MNRDLGRPIAYGRTAEIYAWMTSRRVGNALLKRFTHVFDTAYTRHYFRLRPGGEDEYRRWLPVVTAARLSGNIPELEPWLIAQAEKNL